MRCLMGSAGKERGEQREDIDDTFPHCWPSPQRVTHPETREGKMHHHHLFIRHRSVRWLTRSHPAEDSGGPDSQAFPEEASPSRTRDLQTHVQLPESMVSPLALCFSDLPLSAWIQEWGTPNSSPGSAYNAQPKEFREGPLLKPLRDHHSETPTHDTDTQAFWEQTWASMTNGFWKGEGYTRPALKEGPQCYKLLWGWWFKMLIGHGLMATRVGWLTLCLCVPYMVLWIVGRLPMQGTWDWSLVWEDSTRCREAEPQLLKPAPSRASMLQLLKPTCLEPLLCNERATAMRSPLTTTGE